MTWKFSGGGTRVVFESEDTEPIVSEESFQYDQDTPLATWTIGVPSAMGRRPGVSIFDSNDALILSDVVASETQVTVTFPEPIAGHVILS